MGALTNPILFGSLTLDGSDGGNYIKSIRAVQVNGSIKQRMNNQVTIVEVPGRGKEWQISIEGELTGGNRDADEATLYTYDTGAIRGYTDGKHDGNYIIVPGTLQFDFQNRLKTAYPYRLVIRQYTQSLP